MNYENGDFITVSVIGRSHDCVYPTQRAAKRTRKMALTTYYQKNNHQTQLPVRQRMRFRDPEE
jgi:hypothetical protein